MSNAEVRQNIAAVLNALPGITGWSRRPRALNVGDGYPLWRGAERQEEAPVFLQTFAVVIIVGSGGDEMAADMFADEHGEALIDALLDNQLWVSEMVPAEVATSGGPLMALMITGRTE